MARVTRTKGHGSKTKVLAISMLLMGAGGLFACDKEDAKKDDKKADKKADDKKADEKADDRKSDEKPPAGEDGKPAPAEAGVPTDDEAGSRDPDEPPPSEAGR